MKAPRPPSKSGTQRAHRQRSDSAQNSRASWQSRWDRNSRPPHFSPTLDFTARAPVPALRPAMLLLNGCTRREGTHATRAATMPRTRSSANPRQPTKASRLRKSHATCRTRPRHAHNTNVKHEAESRRPSAFQLRHVQSGQRNRLQPGRCAKNHSSPGATSAPEDLGDARLRCSFQKPVDADADLEHTRRFNFSEALQRLRLWAQTWRDAGRDEIDDIARRT